MPDAITQLVSEESGMAVRQYSTHDFGRVRDGAAISVIVAKGAARDLVDRLRARLGPGWVTFVGTTQWLGDEQISGVEVVVGPGETQLDIVRLARSDAVNYGMGTESLVRKLRTWDEQVGIDVWHAETDTVSLDLKTLPRDLAAFARDVDAFCPDIVSQVVGSLEALERDIAAQRALLLWWD